MANRQRYIKLVEEKLGKEAAEKLAEHLFPDDKPSKWVQRWIRYHAKLYKEEIGNLKKLDYENLPDHLLKRLANVELVGKYDEIVNDLCTFTDRQWFKRFVKYVHSLANPSAKEARGAAIQIDDDNFVYVDPYNEGWGW